MFRQTFFFLLLMLALAGCAGVGLPPPPTATTVTQLSPFEGLVAGIQTQGVDARAGEESFDPAFNVQSRWINLPNGRVQVLEYDGEAAARAEASSISPDGFQVGHTMVDWVAEPHFFRSGRLIILYVGRESSIVEMLTRMFGPQFAGLPLPTATPGLGERTATPVPPTLSSGGTETPRIFPTATVGGGSVGTPTNLDNLIQQARADLAARLQISSDVIQVLKTEAAQWPDSSLGCPQKGMMYMQVITPGYTIVLGAQGKTYEYHTSMTRVELCDNRRD
jgi:hypothetical protein